MSGSRARDLSGMTFGDAKVIGDTGKRTKDGQQIVLLRDSKGLLHETASTNLTRKVYTGYHGSNRNKEVGKHLGDSLTKKDRARNGAKGAASLRRMYFFDGTSPVLWNQKIAKNNISGVKGVSYDSARNKWTATLTYKGKKVLYKRFNLKQDAIDARKAKEKELGIN